MASSILVLGACPSMRMLLTRCLAANQHDVTVADTAQEACTQLDMSAPDVILADASGLPPVTILSELRAAGLVLPSNETVPVILVDRAATPERRVAALSAGARDLVGWPVNQRLLLARLRGVLREVNAAREVRRRDAAAARFGFAEDATGFAPVRSVAFVASPERGSRLDDTDTTALGATVKRLTPEDAIGAPGQSQPIDAFVVDGTTLSTAVSFNTLPELRAREHSRHAAILFIHDADDPDIAASALDSGASDILSSDALADELVHRLNALLLRKLEEDALRRSSENSLRLAATDALTGLYNRRYAQTYLQSALVRDGEAATLTAMIVDIDHFKRINDTHGHAAGDIVLTEVARRMRDNLRSIDMVARFGGEEFLVVLPGTDMSRAGPAADRLRTLIGGTPVAIGEGKTVRVTVSIGVSVAARVAEAERTVTDYAESAAMADTGDQVRVLLAAADKALYLAKETGRNRIKVADRMP